MKKSILWVATLLVATFFVGCDNSREYDICVYGGSSAGVIAAYTAKMEGKSVLLIEPGQRLGGLTSGGLGYTDIGNKQVVTGLSKDFYRRLGTHYGNLEQWIFEPSVAEAIFQDFIKRGEVQVMYGWRVSSAKKRGRRIEKIILEQSENPRNKESISAKMFIDCSYEGDLMARSGVSYTVGREANSQYNETYNGVQLMHRHQFPDGIDPYNIKGDPNSGLLWGISDATVAEDGTGDDLVQAYNYRVCLTNIPENRIEITRPNGYQATKYELLARLLEAQPNRLKLNHHLIWSRMPNGKTDINNRGGFSTDAIGMNHAYPEASYQERARIIEEHKEYTQGLFYFYKTDPRVPIELREEMSQWGYPKDEYVEYENWTPQLYIREARRMVGEYVMTQAHCEGKEVVEDGVAMAAYSMDSHNCQRIVVEKDGVKMVKNEGNVEIIGGLPYPISYRSLTPKKEECENLLSVIAMSASHIAYGSIRMEPVFMVLAQSAAMAAVQAIETGSVHTIDVAKLQQRLKNDPLVDGTPPDIFLDDADLETIANGWSRVKRAGGYGPSFLLAPLGGKFDPVRFNYTVDNSAKYELYTYYRFTGSPPETILYTIFDGTTEHTKTIHRGDVVMQGQTSGDWVSLGNYTLEQGAEIYFEIGSAKGGDTLVADAFLLIEKNDKK